MINYKKVNLLTLLRNVNIFIFLLAFWVSSFYGDNQYISYDIIKILFLSTLVNHIIILSQRKKIDPFLVLLLYVSIFYYNLRVVTLFVSPFSYSFFYISVSPKDVYNTMLYVVLCNILIFCAINFANKLFKKGGITESVSTDYKYSIYTGNLSFLLAILIVLTLLGIARNELFNFFTSYFVNIYILIFLTVILLFSRFKIKNNDRKLLISIISIWAITSSVVGSRSSIISLLQFLIISIIISKSKIEIKSKNLIAGLFLIILSIFIFVNTTLFRYKADYTTTSTFSISRLNEYFSTFKSIELDDIEALLVPVYDRIGFLDYSTYCFVNISDSKSVLNFPYYCKSVIDNGFTPGFNVFNAPKASLRIKYLNLFGQGYIPDNSEIQEDYNSAQFTVYGEYYVLFGWGGGLVAIYLTTLFAKYLFNYILYSRIWYKEFLLALIAFYFLSWLNSFGIDWIFIEMFYAFFTLLIFKSLLRRALL